MAYAVPVRTLTVHAIRRCDSVFTLSPPLCMRYVLTVLVLSGLSAMLIFGQTGEAVRGVLIERATGQPVSYATVTLVRSGDTTKRPVRGTLSLKDGTFLLRNVPPGEYQLVVRLVGYAPFVQSVRVEPGGDVWLGRLVLDQEAIEQRAVEVQAERELMEARLDRRVYTVGKDLTVAGGTATDALQNVPGVTVDQDRTVQLRGSNNITILIDGKPTTLTGGDRSGGTGLDNIPADAIESIEVITTPDASYDAEGAGIINIVLKRERKQQLNALASATIGTRDKYTGFASLGVNAAAVRGDLSYSYSLQNYDFDRRITLLPQHELQRYPGLTNGARPVCTITHTPRLNLESDIGSGTLQATLGGLWQQQQSWATMNYHYYQLRDGGGSMTPTPLDVIEQRRGMQRDSTNGVDVGLSYKIPLVEHWSASADVRYLINRQNSGFEGTMNYIGDGATTSTQQMYSTEQLEQTTAQLDVRYQLSQRARLEAGIKASWRTLDAQQHARADSSDPLVSVLTSDVSARVREQISAGYVQATLPLGPVLAVAGVRLEATDFRVDRSAGDPVRQQYWNLFPTVSINYTLSQLTQLGLRYSRRISRPQNEALSPIVRFDDPYNVRTGNPALQPELMHSLEMAGTFVLPWATLAPTLYWRTSTNRLARYRTFDSATGTTQLYFANWDRMDVVGGELLLQVPIASWWRMTLTGSIGWQSIQAGSLQPGLSNSGWNATAVWQNVLTLGNGWSARVGYNLRYIGPIAQGSIGTIAAGELALRYEFLDSRASLALRVSDPFDQRVFTIAMRTTSFEQDLRFKRESRIAFLTLSYLLGSGKAAGEDMPKPPADEM